MAGSRRPIRGRSPTLSMVGSMKGQVEVIGHDMHAQGQFIQARDEAASQVRMERQRITTSSM